METLSAIEERRSIRGFFSCELEKEKVMDILNCGRLAPSARNRQPWYFVVVQNDKKDIIADMMIEYVNNSNYINEIENLGYKASVEMTANVMKQAPVLVLVFKPKDDIWVIEDNLSIGACVENMCLRATDLEIGSLWIRDIAYVGEEVSKTFGHEDMELNCALSLGYQSKFPKMRPRRELEEIVEWY